MKKLLLFLEIEAVFYIIIYFFRLAKIVTFDLFIISDKDRKSNLLILFFVHNQYSYCSEANLR